MYLAKFEHVLPLFFQVNADTVIFKNNFFKAILDVEEILIIGSMSRV
jgi:hypothetical protein